MALVRELARLIPDRQIARLLNLSGKTTGDGNGWTEHRVCSFRDHHEIAVYRDGEWSQRGERTLDEVAHIIGVAKMTALRMIRRGDLKGHQACKGAPWVIKAEDVAAFVDRRPPTGSITADSAQQTLEFQ
jgi:excisionase family DNA binding protein